MVGKGKIGSIIFILLTLILVKICYSEETVLFEIPHGTGPGELRTDIDNWRELPGPITIDEERNFYICDFYNERIQIFDQKGKYLKSLIDSNGQNAFIFKNKSRIYYYALENNFYCIKYFDLQTDSNYVLFSPYTNSDRNHLMFSYSGDDKFVIVINEKENIKNEEYQNFLFICKKDYDSILCKIVNIVNNYSVLLSRARVLMHSKLGDYLYIPFGLKEADYGFDNIYLFKHSDYNSLVKGDFFPGYYPKLGNIFIDEKNASFYVLYPILIESFIDPLHYEQMSKMKFQMIEFK